MEPPIQVRIITGLAYAQTEAHESAKRFGYWEKTRSLAEPIALIHRDASRALEVITVGDGPSPKIKDCSRLEEALADVIIRCLDVAGGRNLKLASAIVAKMEYNENLSRIVRRDY